MNTPVAGPVVLLNVILILLLVSGCRAITRGTDDAASAAGRSPTPTASGDSPPRPAEVQRFAPLNMEQRHGNVSMFLTAVQLAPSETWVYVEVWNRSLPYAIVRPDRLAVWQGTAKLERSAEYAVSRRLPPGVESWTDLIWGSSLRPDERRGDRFPFTPADTAGPPLRVVWSGVSLSDEAWSRINTSSEASSLPDYVWEVPIR
jgi:hypothetical protein